MKLTLAAIPALSGLLHPLLIISVKPLVQEKNPKKRKKLLANLNKNLNVWISQMLILERFSTAAIS